MSAEVIPFPLHATQSWRFIAEEYAKRRSCTDLRRDKGAYAKRVIEGNTERMQRLGVSPERAAAEIREIEALFARLDEQQQQHSAATA
jgi:hypothetical protein